MKQNKTYPIIVIAIIAICLNKSVFANQQVNKKPFSKKLININWLLENQHLPSLILIDARTQDEYQKFHIPKAINLSVSEQLKKLSNNQPSSHSNNKNQNLSLRLIRDHLSQIGIEKNSFLVIYDDNYLDASRLLWIIESNGHQQVAILNGGINLWLKKNLPITQQVSIGKASQFIPQTDPAKLATKFITRIATLDTNKVIVDVRSQNEYHGKITPYKKAGHIPTSINIPSEQFFTSENQFDVPLLKNKDVLKRVFYRLNKHVPIIVYSNTGKRSALAYTILRALDYNVSNYDGSWYEWSHDPKLPIE